MKLRASFIAIASVLALDAIPREAHAAPINQCLEIDETCDGLANPRCARSEDCALDLPNCDVRFGRCVGACMWDYVEHGVLPLTCPSAARPFCRDDGRCLECTPENAAACGALERPVCVVATGTCGCNFDTDCASGVCDQVTRRCVARLSPPKGTPGLSGAGASSSGASSDAPLAEYGG